jgi:hypothetical protein
MRLATLSRWARVWCCCCSWPFRRSGTVRFCSFCFEFAATPTSSATSTSSKVRCCGIYCQPFALGVGNVLCLLLRHGARCPVLLEVLLLLLCVCVCVCVCVCFFFWPGVLNHLCLFPGSLSFRQERARDGLRRAELCRPDGAGVGRGQVCACGSQSSSHDAKSSTVPSLVSCPCDQPVCAAAAFVFVGVRPRMRFHIVLDGVDSLRRCCSCVRHWRALCVCVLLIDAVWRCC